MIGLDTNVLVRYFVEDDPVQTAKAIRLLKTQCTSISPGFVDRVALCELVWVLSSVHGYARSQIAEVITEMLATEELMLEDSELVQRALQVYSSSAVDFADILIGHVNLARGCEGTATFDRKAAKLKGFVRVS